MEKIKQKYKEKGYLAVTAYLPEQQAETSIIEIRVIEGKRGKLNVEGNKWFSAELIQKYFHTKKNEILDFNKIQKDVLRLNQNPDLIVETIFSAGQEPETSDVTLKVKEHFPLHIGIGSDNQGGRLVGKYRSSFSLRHTNISGRGDYLFLNSLYSSRSFGESLSYTIPADTYGTKFGLDIAYFKMKLGKEFKSYDITGSSQLYTPYLSWELYLSETQEANANVGLDIKSIKKKTDGEVTANDQLRLPYFSLYLKRIDSQGQTSISPRFTFGTEDFLGASGRNHPTASRAGSGGFFFKYEHLLSRIQRMPAESYISLRSQFQVATHTLASSEQIQLGGLNSIRGYPEGDYLADIGGNLNLDWVFPMYLIPKSWKLRNSETNLRNQIEPVFFVDWGGGKLKKVLPGEKHNKFLAGIGGGIRMRLYNAIYLRFEWAEHIGDKPVSGSGPSTFYFTVQTEI
jgi:hemolysin activation/secretion protein